MLKTGVQKIKFKNVKRFVHDINFFFNDFILFRLFSIKYHFLILYCVPPSQFGQTNSSQNNSNPFNKQQSSAFGGSNPFGSTNNVNSQPKNSNNPFGNNNNNNGGNTNSAFGASISNSGFGAAPASISTVRLKNCV